MVSSIFYSNISSTQLKNTKIYVDKYDFLDSLKNNINFLEVGTKDGSYAEKVIEKCNPNSIFLIDFFNKDDMYFKKEQLTNPRFNSKTHLQFIKNKFNNKKTTVCHGSSKNILTKMPTNYFDFIYLDSSKIFGDVWTSLILSTRLLKPGGIIGISRYTYNAPVSFNESDDNHMGMRVIVDESSGIVGAVNSFLEKNNSWTVNAYTLDALILSDIYIQSPII